MKMLVEHPGGRIPTVLGGVSSLERIPKHVAHVRSHDALLVADAAVVETGYVDRVRDALSVIGDVFLHVVPAHEPTTESIDVAAARVRALTTTTPPTVVGVGGGSALDTAKQAAAVAGAAASVEHYALGARPLPARGPLVAIPTTAGTGAEVTRTCVLADHRGRKVWMWGDELLPDLVVLDPSATVTMPRHVTTTTGLDAFVHAIEAATGRRRSALVTAPALHAIRLVLDHLPLAVRDGTDLDVRQSMQEAALLAGLAIDGGGTGIAHSIGHALGTLAHIPHGVTVAVGLTAALAWNVGGCADVFEPVARAVGCATAELADLYAGLLRDADLPSAVARSGALSTTPDELAAAMAAPENMPMLENNCRRPSEAERHWLAERTLVVWDELRSAP